MNEIARVIGAMNPDDPRHGALLKGLSDLTQVRTSVRKETSQSIGKQMVLLVK
jgi:hypothetical protein